VGSTVSSGWLDQNYESILGSECQKFIHSGREWTLTAGIPDVIESPSIIINSFLIKAKEDRCEVVPGVVVAPVGPTTSLLLTTVNSSIHSTLFKFHGLCLGNSDSKICT